VCEVVKLQELAERCCLAACAHDLARGVSRRDGGWETGVLLRYKLLVKM
jgi:hypothetical protein